MNFFEKIKCWFDKNKKSVLIGGTIVLSIVGTGVRYVLCKNSKISFSDWLKIASKEELDEAYEKLRLTFCKTGIRTKDMEKIGQELGERGAKEWFAKHPKNTNPNFRWTDANRWDRD